jgi:hypothetical protein
MARVSLTYLFVFSARMHFMCLVKLCDRSWNLRLATSIFAIGTAECKDYMDTLELINDEGRIEVGGRMLAPVLLREDERARS